MAAVSRLLTGSLAEGLAVETTCLVIQRRESSDCCYSTHGIELVSLGFLLEAKRSIVASSVTHMKHKD